VDSRYGGNPAGRIWLLPLSPSRAEFCRTDGLMWGSALELGWPGIRPKEFRPLNLPEMPGCGAEADGEESENGFSIAAGCRPALTRWSRFGFL